MMTILSLHLFKTICVSNVLCSIADNLGRNLVSSIIGAPVSVFYLILHIIVILGRGGTCLILRVFNIEHYHEIAGGYDIHYEGLHTAVLPVILDKFKLAEDDVLFDLGAGT